MNIIEVKIVMIRMTRNPNNGNCVEPCKQTECNLVNPETGCGDPIGPMIEGDSVVCPLQRGVIYVVGTDMQAK